jgi:hypothetical protein
MRRGRLRPKPSFCGSAGRDREGGRKGIEVTPQGWADRGAGCAARPLRWCKKEGNGRLRCVGTAGVFALRARPHATGTMHDTPFEHFAVAHGDMREVRDPRLLFHAKKLLIRAMVGFGGRVRAANRQVCDLDFARTAAAKTAAQATSSTRNKPRQPRLNLA